MHRAGYCFDPLCDQEDRHTMHRVGYCIYHLWA